MRKLGSALAATIFGILPIIGGLVALPCSAVAQSADEATIVEQQADQLKAQGRYAEAEPLYKRALAIQVKALGPDHPDVAFALNGLAGLYIDLTRFAEAEPLYNRALAIREKALDPDQSNVATTLNDLAFLYTSQGRYAEAEPLYKRALMIRETAFGPDHPDVAATLSNLAGLYRLQARYPEAELLARRALAINEKALGRNDPAVAVTLNYLALLSADQGRYADAELLCKRVLAIREQALGFDHPYVAVGLNNLAEFYSIQGRYADAESLLKRTLTINEKALGPDSPRVAISLNNLAELYAIQGRYADAELLLKRALAIVENTVVQDHPYVALGLNNLAELYRRQGRYADAEPLYKRALAIQQKALNSEHPDAAITLNDLAMLYTNQGRYTDAEPLYQRALAIFEKALGPEHPNVALPLNNLASLYTFQARFGEAEPLLRRSLAIFEKALGPRHPNVATTLNNSIEFYDLQARYDEALPIVRRIIGLRSILNPDAVFDALIGAERGKFATGEQAFRDSYSALQLTNSSAAGKAVAKLALRFAAGSGPLAEIVRKDEDLTAETDALDKSLIAAVSKAPSERNQGAEDQLRKRSAEIAIERADILNVLNQKFPEYLALSKPQPLTVEETEALLDEDEAIVAFYIGGRSNYVWAVTKTDARWTEIPTYAKTLGARVAQLRQSLTFTADRPFDTALAYDIYQDTFGPIANVIAGKKRIFVVANGALTSIPLGILIATDPTGKSLKDVDWLIKSHAITVLPSIYSLKTMRARAPDFDAPKPMIAFADPVFSQQAKAEAKTPRVTLRSLASFYQGSEIDVRALGEALPQLPRTREEVRRVGKALGAGPDDMNFGLDATVTAVERAPLDQYRVVYFATHGLVAGDLAKFAKAKAEPALVLTIPDNPTEEDNGLLTASAVAQLKLNADWIVLSACNTASSDGVGAEALSGLARAFIYAGARSLVVSNWDISDEATADLMTYLFDISSKNPNLSHGEAMQQATLRLLAAAKTEDTAHPRVWAPFMVVGEPAAAK